MDKQQLNLGFNYSTMKLKVINSNSKGNAYILNSKSSTLLIECGMPFKVIKEALDYDVMNIDACLVTHEHQDHCKSIKELAKAGVPIIASPGTKEACEISGDGFTIKHGQKDTICKWQITAFNVEHDAKEPLGFIIEYPECGTILFVTDTYILKYDFNIKFDHVIIEANYCEELRDKWIEKQGKDIVESRRFNSHMSFQTAMLTLERLDLSQCKNIVFIHLSDGLTNEKRFAKESQERFGIKTTVAGPEVEIDFKLTPF